LLERDVLTYLFEEEVNLARERKLLSDEHFSVDGTLLQALASRKSFRRKDCTDDSDGDSPTGPMQSATIGARNAAMTPITPRRTQMLDWPRKAEAGNCAWPILSIRSWKTAMA
jgi:hypothetical protein